MATFQISDPSSTVDFTETAAEGKAGVGGSVPFVVENTAPARRTAEVRILADDPASLSFYTLDGSKPTAPDYLNLDFGPKEVKTVTVRIAAPRGPAERACSFRLRVMLESDPGNDGTDSRPVAFKLPAAAKEAPVPRAFPWPALVAGIVLLAAVAGGVFYVIGRKDGPPPTPEKTAIEKVDEAVRGKSLDFAQGVAAGQSLQAVPHIVRNDAGVPGTVLAARPDPQDAAKVLLDYDPGIAALKGQPVAAAKATAATWPGITVADRRPEAPGEPGIVLDAVLETATPGRLVLVFDEGVAVPNLVGSAPGTIGDTFTPLAGKATATVENFLEDASKCGVSISGQRPLKDATAGATSLYPTGQSFFFTVTKGTKPRCIIIPPDWVLSPNVRIAPEIQPQFDRILQ